jgi:leucyl-tRNA synthetase
MQLNEKQIPGHIPLYNPACSWSGAVSKLLGNVADLFEAIDTFGTNVVRYYLARVGGRFRDDVG